MNNSLRTELTQHVIDHLTDQKPDSNEDLHHYAFNESPYLYGTFDCEQWLADHGVSAFEAIADIIEWQDSAFGEVTLKPEDMNPERIVNLYVYVKGEELLSDFDLDQSPEELIQALKESIA